LKATIPCACQYFFFKAEKLVQNHPDFWKIMFLPSHVHLLLQLPGNRSQRAASAVSAIVTATRWPPNLC